MSAYMETFRGFVYPWHCDHQGHMNTMHYVGMFDQAFWHHFSALGFTQAYMQAQGTGFADVKATIEYRVEQPAGSLIVIETGLLSVGNTSVTEYNRMYNPETGDVAATFERVSVYFDLQARKKTPIPDAMRPVMEANLVEKT